MTQQEKSLLLKDLCGRLPYGVIVTDNRHGNSVITEIDTISDTVYCSDFDEYVPVEKCRSYLRPLSSMTEEEREELAHYDNNVQRTDFFYSHHIDCRYMIEKSLALKAKEGMYNIKE